MEHLKCGYLDPVKYPDFDPNKDYCGTKGCRFIPDKWFGVPINDICYLHDLDYAKGGNIIHKFWSDFRFGMRIFLRGLRHSALIIIGPIYFLGVSIGGLFAWPWRSTKKQ